MNRKHKRYIHPKVAFFILSVLFFLLAFLCVPTVKLYVLGVELMEHDSKYNIFIIWGLSGFLLGIGFAVFSILKFRSSDLAKALPYMLIILMILAFLLYISLQVTVNAT
jgi:hypothetical protein